MMSTMMCKKNEYQIYTTRHYEQETDATRCKYIIDLNINIQR